MRGAKNKVNKRILPVKGGRKEGREERGGTEREKLSPTKIQARPRISPLHMRNYGHATSYTCVCRSHIYTSYNISQDQVTAPMQSHEQINNDIIPATQKLQSLLLCNSNTHTHFLHTVRYLIESVNANVGVCAHSFAFYRTLEGQ